MKADLARTEPDFVSCGELLGLKIPPPGPVPGVQIQWKPLLTEGFQRLIKHGTASYAETTDSHGQADLRFTPDDEAIPGFGELRTETGTLQPGASVLDAFGNVPAGLIEEVTPLFVTLRAWSVGSAPSRAGSSSRCSTIPRPRRQCSPSESSLRRGGTRLR